MSRSSSISSRRHSNLSLDLSDLPPLSHPSPPSNTLLVTNLQDPTIFTAPILSHIEQLVAQHSPDGIHSFCPLRSMRRIIISFPTVQSATHIRSVLDGEAFFGDRIKVYFGSHTRIEPAEDMHLAAPKLDKQFFISPPPSPPAGWEIKAEDPPNKEVHAEDLASALEKLSASNQQPRIEVGDDFTASQPRRQRSGTGTIVYAPEDHGHSPDLPAIAVEDTTNPGDEDISPINGEGQKIAAHTSRPPVELIS